MDKESISIMIEGIMNSELGIFYIISQIFALVAFAFDLLAVRQKKKSSLLNMDTMAAFCSIFHYAFLGAWAGMVSKIVTTVRNAIAAREATLKRKEHLKVLPLIFVGFYIAIGIFTFESFYSLLPILAPSIYTIAIYYCDDVKVVRYVIVITSAIWLMYNICVLSVVGITVQSIATINSLLAVYKYRAKKKNQKRSTKSRK